MPRSDQNEVPLSTIIFDLGGVMVWTHWDKVMRPFSEASGLSTEEVMEEIRTGDVYYPFMRGELHSDEFQRRLSGKLGLNLDPDGFFAAWNSILAPNTEISDLIQRLAGRYRLVIGCNTDALHYARSVEVQPTLRHFDNVLLSYELGCCKPDPAFFRLGLSRLSLRAQKCVFIDDREDNVESARTLGITGIQFLSVQQLESDLAGLGLL